MQYVLALALMVLLSLGVLTGCDDANVASRNLSKAADNFEIDRRIVFYNGITGEYMLTLEGKCSIGSGTSTRAVTVTCKDGPRSYKKHFLGLSDNVTYFVEQMTTADVNAYHHRVTFKPQVILPDIDFRGSNREWASLDTLNAWLGGHGVSTFHIAHMETARV